MLKGDWEVSTLIKFSECGGLGWPFFKCPCSWRAPHLEEGKKYSLAFKTGLKQNKTNNPPKKNFAGNMLEIKSKLLNQGQQKSPVNTNIFRG